VGLDLTFAIRGVAIRHYRTSPDAEKPRIGAGEVLP
jgi:hypothetical protein